MKVKLLASTPFGLNVAYTAASTCYSENGPIHNWLDKVVSVKAMYDLLNKCFKSGHHSVFEHINFTFAIEGISRACSHQLVRHRHCTFSQQSQRYVNMKNAEFVVPFGLKKEDNDKIGSAINKAMEVYNELIENGVKQEDARAILPNCTTTNMVLTCNLRELIHICSLRLCNRAQKEIRELVSLMVREVLMSDYHWRQDYLVPKCVSQGFCTEHKCCGRMPSKEEVVNG